MSLWNVEDINKISEKKINKDILIGELFHGPTAAFKDFGLQLCAAFFNKALEKNNQTAIILGATSGDTGSAAIDACKGYKNIKNQDCKNQNTSTNSNISNRL